jgi:hypothetical protein
MCNCVTADWWAKALCLGLPLSSDRHRFGTRCRGPRRVQAKGRPAAAGDVMLQAGQAFSGRDIALTVKAAAGGGHLSQEGIEHLVVSPPTGSHIGDWFREVKWADNDGQKKSKSLPGADSRYFAHPFSQKGGAGGGGIKSWNSFSRMHHREATVSRFSLTRYHRAGQQSMSGALRAAHGCVRPLRRLRRWGALCQSAGDSTIGVR